MCVLAAPLSATSASVATVQADSLGTLHVSGTASVTITPDRARASFSVETEAATASAASGENASRMEAVIQAVRQSGAGVLSVQTSGYDVRPRYARSTGAGLTDQRIVGYTAVNGVQVTLQEVDEVGRLIDAAISAGANRIASLVFFASETNGARLQALAEAVERARAEAGAIADAMDMELGPALRVQADSPRGGVQALPAFRVEMAQAVTTPVAPGSQVINATVTITYRLEGR